METMYLILPMLAGVLLRVVLKWDSANRTKKVFDFKMAASSAALSVLTMIVLIFVRADIEGVLPFTPFLAMVYGYTGDSIFRAIVKKFKPAIK